MLIMLILILLYPAVDWDLLPPRSYIKEVQFGDHSPEIFPLEIHTKLIQDLRSSAEKVSCKVKFKFQHLQVRPQIGNTHISFPVFPQCLICLSVYGYFHGIA